MFLVLISYWNMNERVSTLAAWANFVSNLCFWAAMVSYMSLSLLKLYGVANPLSYQHYMMGNRCKRLIGYSWLSFTALILTLVMVGVALQRTMSRKTWLGYAEWANRVLTVFPALVYVATVACFLCTRRRLLPFQEEKIVDSVFFIRRIERLASSVPLDPRKSVQLLHKTHTSQIPLLKLSANVSSLAIFHLPIFFWAVYNSMVDDEHKYRLILCVAKTHFHLVQSMDGLLKVTLLARILLDALMGFALDKELRRHMPRWRLCGECYNEMVAEKTTTSTSRGSGGERVEMTAV